MSIKYPLTCQGVNVCIEIEPEPKKRKLTASERLKRAVFGSSRARLVVKQVEEQICNAPLCINVVRDYMTCILCGQIFCSAECRDDEHNCRIE